RVVVGVSRDPGAARIRRTFDRDADVLADDRIAASCDISDRVRPGHINVNAHRSDEPVGESDCVAKDRDTRGVRDLDLITGVAGNEVARARSSAADGRLDRAAAAFLEINANRVRHWPDAGHVGADVVPYDRRRRVVVAYVDAIR